MTSNVQCGALLVDGSYTPVFCNPITGECSYLGERLIFEISAALPLSSTLEEAAEDAAAHNALGIIYSEEATILVLSTSEVLRVDKESGKEETYHINVYGG